MPPPPLPIVRTESLVARMRQDQLVIEPVGGAPIFARLEEVAGGRYQSLWLAPASIFDLTVVPHGEGTALLELKGLFRRYNSYKGDPHCERWLGPIATEEAELVRAKLAAAIGLPRAVIATDEATLKGNPGQFHGRWIELAATWRTGLEHTSVAGLWFEPPGDYAFHEFGESVRSIVGFVQVAQDGKNDGFGHFGRWPGSLQAVSMTPPPAVRHQDVGR